jgi:eukaryotic-like serine/threonine-protein kinase
MDGAARTIAELTGSARRRVGVPARTTPFAVDPARDVNALVAAVHEAASGAWEGVLAPAIEATCARLAIELPAPIALTARAVLVGMASAGESEWDDVSGVTDLMYDGGSGEPELPDWVPASRTLGGFYIQRRLGSGAGGSVFLACRIEERHAPDAELVALKVPDYDGGAARSLSEEEFSRLFREEASALLSLPAHPNLAGFVTFDAGARPKPILVMELVRGASLESLLDRGELDTRRALAVLDGVAGGLEAMHRSRIAHLDIKPANVILRDAEAGTAVLVDFGLAGRSLRPGCGSPFYGAPEVWKPVGDPPPEPADVYAFACLMYELLTGQPLVKAATPVAVVTAHLTGNAGRDVLRELAAVSGLAPLAQLIQSALVREPGARPRIGEMRKRLEALAPALVPRPWPLASGA